jgi:SSS family solute:Na+ symporter
MWPHIFMKAFNARDAKTLRRTVVLYPTFQLFLLPLILVGFAGVFFATRPDTADFILPHVLIESRMPWLIVGLFCAGALAASMSTGDALLHAAGSVAIEDGLAPFVRMSDRTRRRLMQILVLVFGLLAYYLAIIIRKDLVLILLTAYAFIDQLAPPVYATLYWRRATTAGVLTGLAGGMTTALFFVFRPELKPFGIHEGMLGLVVNIVLMIAVSLATPRQAEDHVRPFVHPEQRAPDR